jgi:hypothetical protein
MFSDGLKDRTVATINRVAAPAANIQRFVVFLMDSFAVLARHYSQSHSLNKSVIR